MAALSNPTEIWRCQWNRRQRTNKCSYGTYQRGQCPQKRHHEDPERKTQMDWVPAWQIWRRLWGSYCQQTSNFEFCLIVFFIVRQWCLIKTITIKRLQPSCDRKLSSSRSDLLIWFHSSSPVEVCPQLQKARKKQKKCLLQKTKQQIDPTCSFQIQKH